jgi:LytR cell envelope-related transcriptional attenuator
MHLVQEIGSYAGFAAVVGLAVLSALYFSQARDVKRLREWAGRAPERAAEQEARIAAQAQEQRTAAAAGGGAAAVAPSPVRPQAAPTPGAAAAAGSSPPTLTGTRPAPTAATPILGSKLPDEPWYRRINWPAPRYIALILVGLLVLGAGAVYGVSQLSDNGGGGGGAAQVSNDNTGGTVKAHNKHTTKKAPPAINPKSITVAVLNGTTVTGLAATVADKVEQAGFTRGNTTNALTQGQQAESVVEYSRGNLRAAQLVAKKLGISQKEPIDPQTQSVAGDATVTVIVGADKATAATG